jgi:DNA-binding transcriptional regulator GbsR (MarR family)
MANRSNLDFLKIMLDFFSSSDIMYIFFEVQEQRLRRDIKEQEKMERLLTDQLETVLEHLGEEFENLQSNLARITETEGKFHQQEEKKTRK